jgi:hypothetical protein
MGGMITVFNPGRGPALLDSQGRTLGAGDWVEADPDDPQTAHALNVGTIIKVEGKSGGDK